MDEVGRVHPLGLVFFPIEHRDGSHACHLLAQLHGLLQREKAIGQLQHGLGLDVVPHLALQVAFQVAARAGRAILQRVAALAGRSQREVLAHDGTRHFQASRFDAFGVRAVQRRQQLGGPQLFEEAFPHHVGQLVDERGLVGCDGDQPRQVHANHSSVPLQLGQGRLVSCQVSRPRRSMVPHAALS